MVFSSIDTIKSYQIDIETAKKDVDRIYQALIAAGEIASKFTPVKIKISKKDNGNLVTNADIAINKILKKILPRENEGWLSEETIDDKERLNKSRVWVVDPIDGTNEFIRLIPEWSISICLVINGIPMVGGIFNPNPIRPELFLGALGFGITLNGNPVRVSNRKRLNRCIISVSNNEYDRGDWEKYKFWPITIVPCGSIAYKLARVSAGIDDATFTLRKKEEWDIAAGVCLINAAGGQCIDITGNQKSFNQYDTQHDGLIAGPSELVKEILNKLSPNSSPMNRLKK
jgi:myo-inositol-1(or 4)-monophosphatase